MGSRKRPPHRRFARYEYGPWSAQLDFCLNGSGIDEAEAATITLTPNPAAERVTVAAVKKNILLLRGKCVSLWSERTGTSSNSPAVGTTQVNKQQP